MCQRIVLPSRGTRTGLEVLTETSQSSTKASAKYKLRTNHLESSFAEKDFGGPGGH